MKKFLSSSTGLLLIGIVLFLIGCIQPALYDDAKASGYEVESTIVDIEEGRRTDAEGESYTCYEIYGDYMYDSKEYKHVLIAKHYDNCDCYVGKKMKVVVNPKNPAKPYREGGVVAVIGFVLIIVAVVVKIRTKIHTKRSANAKNMASEPNGAEPQQSAQATQSDNE